MMRSRRVAILTPALALTSLTVWLAAVNLTAQETSVKKPLRESLLFHASFDGQADADLAQGDPRIHTSLTPERDNPQPGITTDTVALAEGAGRYGDALRFERHDGPRAILFRDGRNMGYRPRDWNGTVSFWLRLDPDRDLAPGFCDPVQITERAWNDAAFFVDFTKDDSPRHFRLGVFSDLSFWNPKGVPWEEVPVEDRPLAIVEQTPFGSDRWTHVAFTFRGINADEDAVARLYLDGRLHGSVAPRRQVFTWDESEARILLGLAYVGLMDDLAVFNRELSGEEIQTILELDRGIRDLRE
jgi:hypothetical protein